MDDLMEELRNMVLHPEGVWPGDTLSHKTACSLVERGWAKCDEEGLYYPTNAGALRYVSDLTDRTRPKRLECDEADGTISVSASVDEVLSIQASQIQGLTAMLGNLTLVVERLTRGGER